MKSRLLPIAAGIALIAGSSQAQLDRSGPPSAANALARDTAKVEAGSQHFRQLCTGCHGRGGEGGQGEGQGPNLATNWEVRRAKDAELFSFIRNGVKGTAMPAFPLPDDQIWQLAAFVRSLNAPANTLPVSGNIAEGEAVFFGKGQCSSCHMIRGRGGYLGPDLSDIGATRRLGEIRNALLNPSREPSSNFQPVVLKTDEGQTLKAVAKHATYWSAQIIDERGGLHLVHGDAVHQLNFQKESWISGEFAQRLSPTEMTDLIAYLSRQAVRTSSPNATASKGNAN